MAVKGAEAMLSTGYARNTRHNKLRSNDCVPKMRSFAGELDPVDRPSSNSIISMNNTESETLMEHSRLDFSTL